MMKKTRIMITRSTKFAHKRSRRRSLGARHVGKCFDLIRLLATMHRASHKKTKHQFNEEYVKDQGNKVVVEDRVFGSPYCLRVFESGQALGGHKKVNFSNFGDIARSPAKSFRHNLIDLDLLAPEEEEVSQVAFSIVSNAA
ncbi:hypothetical protein FH972_008150 [Carpinus fangiana]|uniref:C2H2-type domain-containing protein n=1 Tax=Carpinus fangiana TaxID=176857 RepID=A0A5N6R0J8_9ROSI|nr:hypothetical protein FH972_008150 [Carpinus fangiana]